LVHQHVRPPLQAQSIDEPHPGVTGLWVVLHSPPSPPFSVQAAAGVQQLLLKHVVPTVLQLPLQLTVVPAGLHEF